MTDDQASLGAIQNDDHASSSDPMLSTAPPSISVLSDVPTSEPAVPALKTQNTYKNAESGEDIIQVTKRQPTARTQPIDESTNSKGNPTNNAVGIATTEWEAARAKVMDGMATTQGFPQTSQQTPTTPQEVPKPKNRGGRPRKRASLATHGAPSTPAATGTPSTATPTSTGRARGVGRGRGGGRPRKHGGPTTTTGRGGKRKRADDDENASVSSSDSSDEVVETATQTKSGRAVQKPTSFVPPPNPSPSTDKPVKRRRAYHRNPQSAVCKVCLRGTSPESNMIVFCDGCNTPWHQYCHHPPISKAVVQQVDAEWFCQQCELDRRQTPAPAALEPIVDDVEELVSAEGSTTEERNRYFLTLPHNRLATLLTKATTLHPSLPLFAPSFRSQQQNPQSNAQTQMRPPLKNSLSTSYPMPTTATPATSSSNRNGNDEDNAYGSDVHPSHYPRPGFGLMATLPPDWEDETLVDDKNSVGVFSHIYRVDKEGEGGESEGDGQAEAMVGAERKGDAGEGG